MSAPGLEGTYREGFLDNMTGVVMQGTGLAEDGRYITVDWEKSDRATNTWVFEYGIGGSSGTPEAMRTVATRDVRLKPGMRIVIERWAGRVFVVNDTGGGLAETGQVDVFIGLVYLEEAFRPPYGKWYSRVGVVK